MNEAYRHPGMDVSAGERCCAPVGRLSLCIRVKGHPGNGHLPLPRHMPMPVGPWTVSVVRDVAS